MILCFSVAKLIISEGFVLRSVGATRAVVDSGFAPNDLQVRHTDSSKPWRQSIGWMQKDKRFLDDA